MKIPCLSLNQKLKILLPPQQKKRKKNNPREKKNPKKNSPYDVSTEPPTPKKSKPDDPKFIQIIKPNTSTLVELAHSKEPCYHCKEAVSNFYKYQDFAGKHQSKTFNICPTCNDKAEKNKDNSLTKVLTVANPV